MERFVFFAAITFAVIFGIVAMARDGFHMEFDHEGDGIGSAPIVETAPGRLEAQVFEGGELSLRHLAAIVTITPEDRTNFEIAIESPGGAPMPLVSLDDGVVAIDGQLRGRIANCSEGGVDLRGYDEVATENLPRITIRAPRSLQVSRGGAGTTTIGAAQSLELAFTGCGSASVGDVADQLSIDLSGSGEVSAGAAGHLKTEVSGSGDVRVGAVAAGADVDISGSGEVIIASLNGDFSSEGAGSGEITIQAGAIGAAEIDIAGSGDVRIAAPVQTLNVDIAGSGEVNVDGVVGNIQADIVGSGAVRARSVTGAVEKDVLGSGDVYVGGEITP